MDLPALLAPYGLSPAQLAQLSAYLELLLRWNARTNLTSVRDPDKIVTRHIGESLFAARHLVEPGAALRAADVGSGAGFPGLPLKIWAPGVAMTLIESQNKKATFLREVVRALGLEGVEVYQGRAEELSAAAYGLVTLRAVEKFAAALPVAARLVGPGGRLGLLIGAAQAETARNLLPHLRWSEPLAVPLSNTRILLTGQNQDRHVPAT